MADGVGLAFGIPDTDTGGVASCGYRMLRDSSGNLDFDGITGTTWATVMHLDKSNLSLSNAPSSGSHAVTKDYVDKIKVTSVSGNYTAGLSDRVIEVDASGGAITITLYATGSEEGRRLTIRKIDSTASIVTIDGDGGETINGSLTLTLLSQYDSAQLYVGDAEWGVL